MKEEIQPQTIDSGPDINDELMKSAGFHRDPKRDNPLFNSPSGRITYWINDKGIFIITTKDLKCSLEYIVNRVADNAAYQTRNRLRKQMSSVGFDENGFVKD